MKNLILPLLFVLGISAKCPADLLPEISVSSDGVGGVWLKLSGIAPGQSWTFQDTYDGTHWRDLGSYDGNAFHARAIRHQPVRLFRASTKAPSSPQQALDEAKAKWQDYNLTEYQYIHSRSGEFGFIAQLAAVKDGELFDDFPVTVHSPLDPQRPPTIDQLLQQIQSAIDEEADSIVVLYHPNYGYPETIMIDYDFGIADEEWFSDIQAPPQPVSAYIGVAESKWECSLRDRNYRYSLEFNTAWWRWEGIIEVIDGVAHIAGENEPVSEHIIRTIGDHLRFIRNAAEDSESEVAAHFDEATGAPVFLSKDWRDTFFDGTGEHYFFTDVEFFE